MASLVPVDHDPFAASVPVKPTAGLVPVEGDPFAAPGGPASRKGDFGAAPLPGAELAPEANPLTKDASWGNVASTAGSNLLPSAKRFGSDILNAIIHPIDTAQNIGGVLAGVAEKVIPGEQSHEVYADAVGKFFSDRYGGIDNIKRTMAEDPVGFLADLSTVLTGGSTLAAKVPGISKAASVASKVGRAIDPINATVKGVKAVGSGLGNTAAAFTGLTSGVGAIPLKTAAKAGFEGGEAAKALRDNMRGAVPMEDVIGDAKTALQNIRNDRQAAYTAGMTDLAQDQTVLDFNKIDRAMTGVRKVKEFEGKNSGIIVSLEPSTAKTVDKIDDVLSQWRQLPPDDFHTPVGLDALKQRLGDIVDKTKPGSASRKVATQAYNIVKNQIVAQAPEYARTMAGYEQASTLIREMEGTLSLNRNARVDTQLRKLQSVMRDNVTTSYGQRVKLAKMLQDAGATNLLQKLAGQSLASIAPRGIARAAAGVTDIATLGAIVMHPGMWPILIGQLATQSPRLMGEVAYLGGRGAKVVSKIPARAALKGAYAARGVGQERTRP